MGFVADLAVGDAVPDMTTALSVFAVPGEGTATVQSAQIGQRLL
jgi:hypothetical protein